MKKIALTAALLATAGAAAISTAEAKWTDNAYIAANIGLASVNDADFTDNSIPASGNFGLDNGFTFSGALGLRLSDNVRAEIELSHRKNDLDSLTVGAATATVNGDLSTFSGLVNGYYDFNAGQSLRPYLSAGIGFASHDGEVSGGGVTVSEDDTVFAYQIGTGASYQVADQTSLVAGWRYLGSADPEFSTFEAEYDAHEFRVGFRYEF